MNSTTTEDDEDSQTDESDEYNHEHFDLDIFTSFHPIEISEKKFCVEEGDGDTILFGDEGEASLASHIAANLTKETSPVPFINGMDQVGIQIETIRSWIEQVHRISQTLFLPSKFLIPNLLSSYNDSSDDSIEKHLIPIDVGVTSELEESLKCLSSSLEYAVHNDEQLLKTIVENVAGIPSLMKTIILIEDDDDRERVLAYPIIKRVMLCENSIVGKVHGEVDGRVCFSSWFVDLLKTRDASLGSKVVDYFELVSNLTVRDFMFTSGGIDFEKNPTPTVEDVVDFNEKRDKFFEAFNHLPKLMPSMLLLKDRDIERASVTSLIRHILDWNLSRPFGVGVIFLDLLSNLLLVLDFRLFSMSSYLLDTNKMDIATAQQQVWNATPLLLGLISLMYLIFRRVGEAISMLSVSWKVFLIHFFGFWNLVSITSSGLALACYVIGLSYFFLGAFRNYSFSVWFDLIAITIGFLWLNLLGFLKIVNKELATFVLAIAQILKDIRLFLAVMLILVLAFGDMLFLNIASNENVCPENFSLGDDNSSNITVSENLSAADQTLLDGIEQIRDETFETLENIMDTNPYCESQGQSYLGVYRVFIGDISLDYFNGTKITTALFVLLTFFGIIIFLNVLIALVCESYEKSQLQANRLFGRARVTHVSAIIALESLILRRSTKTNNRRFLCSCSGWIRIFMFFFSVTIAFMGFLMLVLLSFVLFDGLIALGLNEGLSIFIVIAVIAPLIFGWFVASSFLLTGSDSGKWYCLAKIQHCALYKYLFVIPIMFVTRRLLGTSKITNHETDDNSEWCGRMKHMENFVEHSFSSLEGCMTAAVSELQKCIEQNRHEIKTFKKQFEEYKAHENSERKAEKESMLSNFDQRFKEYEERIKAERKAEIEMLEHRLADTIFKAVSVSTRTKKR